jgi:hypothetical protein
MAHILVMECRLVALFGPDRPGWRRLFLRVKRTAQLRARTSEFDPMRTWEDYDVLDRPRFSGAKLATRSG